MLSDPSHRAISYGAATVLIGLIYLVSPSLDAQAVDRTPGLSSPLTLPVAIEHAAASRAEIRGAHATLAAAQERPRIAGALDDPMIMAGIDHYPYRVAGASMQAGDGMDPTMPAGGRFDWSIQVEQQFPLSRLRSNRRRAAEAGIDVERASLAATRADVARQVADAFFMLLEAEAMVELGITQLALADDFVEVGVHRLAVALGSQAELMLAEAERARLAAEFDAAQARVNAARAMFNAALGRPVTAPLPHLEPPDIEPLPPSSEDVLRMAVAARSELAGMQAELRRADAEVGVMRSMGAPMGFVRIGEARTMAEGRGAMAMVGVSVPLARSRVRAGLSEARAMQAMAEADVEAMRRMVEAEAVSAREQVVAARARVLAYRHDVVPRARRAVEPALSAYAAGTGTLSSVLDAMQGQWRAEEAQVMATSELGRSWAALHRAIGEDLSR